MKNDDSKPSRINYYNYEEMDKLHQNRAKKWMRLFLKAQQDDQKAAEDLKQHEKHDREITKKARAVGHYWGVMAWLRTKNLPPPPLQYKLQNLLL